MTQDPQVQAQILLLTGALDQHLLVHHSPLDKVIHLIIPKLTEQEPVITTMMTGSPAAATVGTTGTEDFMSLIFLIQMETAEEVMEEEVPQMAITDHLDTLDDQDLVDHLAEMDMILQEVITTDPDP